MSKALIPLELAGAGEPVYNYCWRGVAQLGSALGSGPRGREFKSPLPDQFFGCLLIFIRGIIG